MVNYELKDYTVNTAITFHTGFDDRENNCLMYEGMKEKIKHDIQTAFLSDESLKGYITSDLTLRFLDGYKVRVEYEFSWYRIESISSKAEEMGMGWLDELESMVFR